MKITIKIDVHTLYTINRFIGRKDLFYALNIQGKSRQSQLIEIREIFLKKGVAVALRESTKSVNITLRYHLAVVLLELLQCVLSLYHFAPLEATKIDQLKNDLHQKLL